MIVLKKDAFVAYGTLQLRSSYISMKWSLNSCLADCDVHWGLARCCTENANVIATCSSRQFPCFIALVNIRIFLNTYFGRFRGKTLENSKFSAISMKYACPKLNLLRIFGFVIPLYGALLTTSVSHSFSYLSDLINPFACVIGKIDLIWSMGFEAP